MKLQFCAPLAKELCWAIHHSTLNELDNLPIEHGSNISSFYLCSMSGAIFRVLYIQGAVLQILRMVQSILTSEANLGAFGKPEFISCCYSLVPKALKQNSDRYIHLNVFEGAPMLMEKHQQHISTVVVQRYGCSAEAALNVVKQVLCIFNVAFQ